VRLKVTGEEQEKMRQSIEKQRETKSAQNSVTVMFHDRRAFLVVADSFRARASAAPSLSDALTVGGPVVFPDPSLPSNLKVSAFRAHSRASPNSLSQTAAANPTITITEQRRCAAA